MPVTFMTGLIGSIILVLGAAWPEVKSHKAPYRSLKNWLFAAGAVFMLIYAIMNWTAGGSIFFVLLEILIMVATILMMLNTDDRLDFVIISVAALGLIIWSFTLFTGYSTIIFIVGLTITGLGYVFEPGTLRRGISLTLGSAIIAIFSLMEANWIFFALNTFFSLFSGFYLVQELLKRSKK